MNQQDTAQPLIILPDSALRCPLTHAELRPAPPALLAQLQAWQAERSLRDAAARLVVAPFDAAWLTADGARAYLQRAGVMDLRVDAAVLLAA